MTRFMLITALATAIAWGGCGGDEANKAGGDETAGPVVLSLANPNQREDVDEFVRAVTDESDGSIEIKVEDGWREGEVDFERGTIEDVQAGKADMGAVGARAFDLFGVKSLQPVVAPFAVDSYALEREVLNSPVSAKMLSGVGDIDLVGLALLPGELRKPIGVKRELIDAADYEGATIGIRPSKLSAQTFAALGADSGGYPLDQPVPELDGIEAHLTGFEGSPYANSSTSVAINVNLWPRPVAIVMNQDSYDALSEDQRQVLTAAGQAAVDPAIDAMQNEDQVMGVLCRSGQVELRTATPQQLDELRAATSEISDSLASDDETRGAVEEIAAMRAEIDPEPAPSCPGEDSSEPAAAEPAPFDGAWRVETTKQEAAEVVPAHDLTPENWGETTLAFRDGRFAFTTENGDVCIWAAGAYEVKGETVDLSIEDAGGKGEANSPGELFTFRWSIYRDQLTLKAEPGAVSPEPFLVKPFRRVGDEATVEALSGRRECRPPSDALG